MLVFCFIISTIFIFNKRKLCEDSIVYFVFKMLLKLFLLNLLFFRQTILVNRGWVPRKKLDPSTRQSGQVTSSVELTGIVRKQEGRTPFMNKRNNNIFGNR